MNASGVASGGPAKASGSPDDRPPHAAHAHAAASVTESRPARPTSFVKVTSSGPPTVPPRAQRGRRSSILPRMELRAFHYAFLVRDLDLARRFYVDVLGCRE